MTEPRLMNAVPKGRRESSPGRQSWVKLEPSEESRKGRHESSPGRQSWVKLEPSEESRKGRLRACLRSPARDFFPGWIQPGPIVRAVCEGWIRRRSRFGSPWTTKLEVSNQSTICHPEPERTRISCCAAVDRAACTAFRKESRMNRPRKNSVLYQGTTLVVP